MDVKQESFQHDWSNVLMHRALTNDESCGAVRERRLSNNVYPNNVNVWLTGSDPNNQDLGKKSARVWVSRG